MSIDVGYITKKYNLDYITNTEFTNYMFSNLKGVMYIRECNNKFMVMRHNNYEPHKLIKVFNNFNEALDFMKLYCIEKLKPFYADYITA